MRVKLLLGLSVPSRVTTRLLGSQGLATDRSGEDDGVRIGQFEVVVDTTTPGPIATSIAVSVSGRDQPPDVVAVAGRVAARVELDPPSLVLPRASVGGPLYTASCLVRSPFDGAVVVTVDSCPPGVTVGPLPPGAVPVAAVAVSLDPAEVGRNGPHPKVVRLRARAGDVVTVLELPVVIQH